jgi:hypothetical protein
MPNPAPLLEIKVVKGSGLKDKNVRFIGFKV